MIQIHFDIKIDFDALLVKKEISEKVHSSYSSWLRYYPGFVTSIILTNQIRQAFLIS